MPETNQPQDPKVTEGQFEKIRGGATGNDLSEAPPDSKRSDVIAVNGVQTRTKSRKSCRRDSGKLHRVRHGILSQRSPRCTRPGR